MLLLNGLAAVSALTAEVFLTVALTNTRLPIRIAAVGVTVYPVLDVMLTPELAKSEDEYVFRDTDYKFLRYKAVHRTDPVPEVLDGLAASHTNALAFVAMSMYGEASHPSVAHPIHATNV